MAPEPDPRIVNAFRAAHKLGITKVRVKPVLKDLLKAYEKNWNFIEEDNYRVLIDAIYQKEEEQAAQPGKDKLDADAQLAEEKTRGPNEDVQVAMTKKRNGSNQEIVDEEAEAHRELDSPLKRLRKSYQGNPVASSSLALLNPADKLLPLEASVGTMNPDDRSNGVPDSSCERRTNNKFKNNVDESAEVELASVGEMKISMRCISFQGGANFHLPSRDELLKRTEDECLQSDKFLGPSFSVRGILDKLCECALGLATSSKELEKVKQFTPDHDDATKVPLTPKRSVHPQGAQVEEAGILCLPPAPSRMESAIMGVKPLQLMPLETSSPINYINDISKGVENVAISLVYEVGNELPPAFHYIRGNIKSAKADVWFSLARMGDSHCSTCSGDCATSPCACGHATGGVVYDVGSLLKEEFLEECIRVERDSLKQSRSYCMDCPMERSNEENAKEGCNGHLVRKFIKECWWKCNCNGLCSNRVVQGGLKRKLQVFMTATGKGWGLRTLEELPKGSFVCEFAGEILTTNELYRRISESSSMEKHEFPVLLDADWKGRLMKDEQALCLDAACYGNVARFINHRCFDANLVGIPVEVDTPEHYYYHYALFTTRKVAAFEELTRDYGYDFYDDGNKFKSFECLCDSEFCCNLKRMSRLRLTKRRG